MPQEDRIKNIKNCIVSYPNFPKDGIIFRDFLPILRNPAALDDLISIFCELIQTNHPEVTCVAGVESRGFLIGPLVSAKLRLPFFPIRKSGKLPGEVKQMNYSLEYGNNCIELQAESFKTNDKIVVIDDLLATGGSMDASVKLIESCGGQVLGCLVVIELPDLEGRKKVHVPLHSLVQYK